MERSCHNIHISSSQNMGYVPDGSVDLVVTSPPYPIIEMWDDSFEMQNPYIGKLLKSSPLEAFELMHRELDLVWYECFRVLRPGGIMCINIGDATRTVNGVFQLFNNHSRVVTA